MDILALRTLQYMAKRCKSILENNIYLLLFHVEPQARAKHDFDLQPTANISLFFLTF